VTYSIDETLSGGHSSTPSNEMLFVDLGCKSVIDGAIEKDEPSVVPEIEQEMRKLKEHWDHLDHLSLISFPTIRQISRLALFLLL
jgi:hypothetical protein